MDEQHIGITVDTELMSKAQTILNSHGLDLNTAVNDYLEKIVKEGLETSETEQKKLSFSDSQEILSRAEVCGILKGKVWMADDFDAPLDDLIGYE